MSTETTQPTIMRDGTTVTDRRLGRLEHQPAENRSYTVQRLLAERDALLTAEARRSRGWTPGPGMDQGNEGQCVIYGNTHRRNATPKPLRPPFLDQAAMREDYHRIQHADAWPGCYLGAKCPIQPDAANAYEGTSVHAAMAYGKTQGWWSSYWWAGAGSGDVLGDIVKGNATAGGLVLGLNWFNSMFQPRPSGLLEVDLKSGLAGGHCLYMPSVRLKARMPKEWTGTKEIVVLQQSWGEKDYGVADLGRPGGMVYMLLDDLGALMEQRGEGAVIVR